MRPSIFGHTGIDVVGPGGDAAGQVDEMTLKAGALQRIDGLGAASTHLAVHNRLAIRIDLVHAIEHLAQRNQFGIWYLGDLVLMRLAHVDNLNVFAAVDSPLEFSG